MFEKISRSISAIITQEKTDTPKKIDISILEPNYIANFKNFFETPEQYNEWLKRYQDGEFSEAFCKFSGELIKNKLEIGIQNILFVNELMSLFETPEQYSEWLKHYEAARICNRNFDSLFKTEKQYNEWLKRYEADGIKASVLPTTSPNACLLADQIKEKLTITPIHHSSSFKSNKRPSQLGFFTEQANVNVKSEAQSEEEPNKISFCW
ncbi:hypothetical protein Lsai_2913 [Legionella sainthelensi]|uniref:Uncharacterized protein n=1 Tax=Legionella sainthelensi TaxID=28087 RepID=A0A0W0YB63_9GAMM|nr:hypothetical protein [Legionella sainthelensi]KTD54091.1 hypothetical protein Lsai_2913 [Legionella sainthelensi]VEH35552.1 Uncharacterised protein [Legionella sainthelensi]